MNSPKKVYGIVPPTGKFIREDRCQTPIKNLKTISLRPPMDLLHSMASFEAAGCECRLLDYPAEDRGWDTLERELREFAPDILLLSITTPSLPDDMAAAKLAKKVDPSILTVAKGAHFNVHDCATLKQYPDLDMALRGEYEETCAELAAGKPYEEILGITYRNSEGKVVKNADRPLIKELDALPYPARHLANNALYTRPDTGVKQTTIVTNRGCPFHCIYCLANQVSGTRNRYRSVENVMGEIRECVEKHDIRSFLFRSDLFTQNKKWVTRLCEAILDSGLEIDWACNSRVDTLSPEVLGWMKKAGCWIIAFGVESGDQQTLDRIDKSAKVEDSYQAIRWTREAGIKSSVYLLMGLPWETRESAKELEAYALRLDPDILEIFYAYPFPGTPLYELCVKEGLIEDGDIPKQAYDGPAMPGLYLTADEMKNMRRKVMRGFYLRPSKIYRTFRSVRSAREFAGYVRHGMIQLKDLLVGG